MMASKDDSGSHPDGAHHESAKQGADGYDAKTSRTSGDNRSNNNNNNNKELRTSGADFLHSENGTGHGANDSSEESRSQPRGSDQELRHGDDASNRYSASLDVTRSGIDRNHSNGKEDAAKEDSGNDATYEGTGASPSRLDEQSNREDVDKNGDDFCSDDERRSTKGDSSIPSRLSSTLSSPPIKSEISTTFQDPPHRPTSNRSASIPTAHLASSTDGQAGAPLPGNNLTSSPGREGTNADTPHQHKQHHDQQHTTQSCSSNRNELPRHTTFSAAHPTNDPLPKSDDACETDEESPSPDTNIGRSAGKRDDNNKPGQGFPASQERPCLASSHANSANSSNHGVDFPSEVSSFHQPAVTGENIPERQQHTSTNNKGNRYLDEHTGPRNEQECGSGRHADYLGSTNNRPDTCVEASGACCREPLVNNAHDTKDAQRERNKNKDNFIKDDNITKRARITNPIATTTGDDTTNSTNSTRPLSLSTSQSPRTPGSEGAFAKPHSSPLDVRHTHRPSHHTRVQEDPTPRSTVECVTRTEANVGNRKESSAIGNLPPPSSLPEVGFREVKNNNNNNNSDNIYVHGESDNKCDDGNNVNNEDDEEEDEDSFVSDYRHRSRGNLSLELQPLLPLSSSSEEQEKHTVFRDRRKRPEMANPTLQSYRKSPPDDHDVGGTGHHSINGDVPSSNYNGDRLPEVGDKANHNNGNVSDSNGVVMRHLDSLKVSKSQDGNYEVNDQEDDDDEDAEPCGWGPVQLDCCQKFRSPRWFLLVVTLCGACQGMAINGFVNTVISTIEKRFEISSTESGLIASCYDIMFVLLVIPISYFGGMGNKPRYIGIGIFLLGLGSFVFSLPHFISGQYQVGDAQDTICQGNSSQPTSCSLDDKSGSLSNYKYFFFLGQLLHGAGATALYTLGVVFMDENVSQRSSSVYNGIFYTGAIVGPAVGYIVGSELLKIYTDIGVDPDRLGLDVNNPKWVGAWWIGFIISGIFAFCLALPLLAFPPALPGSKKYARERGVESQAQKGVDKTGQHKGIKDILLSIKLLLTNLPFMFINLAAAADSILVGGFSTFMPKFIEYQFGLSSSKAALYMGLAVVPTGGGATFLGGFLVTYFNLRVRGILRLCVVAAFLLMLHSLALLMQCETGKFAGVNTLYRSEQQVLLNSSARSLESSCNQNCNCQEEDYFPMCGVDGVLYFSPCYAGCTGVKDTGSDKQYYNCTCLDYNFSRSDRGPGSYDGVFGKCDDGCKWLVPFMLLFSTLIVLMFITSMPSLTATLRCVPDHQRSFGLGIQWIVARCLGSIPGPILFGKMFDLACELWQKRCNGTGSCFFYDNEAMRLNLLSVSIVFSFLATLFFFLANWFYKAKIQDETMHVELKRSKDSFRLSQNTILPETPTVSQTSVTPTTSQGDQGLP